jgi:N-acyl-D-aspartate/D-glutamate deacylase
MSPSSPTLAFRNAKIIDGSGGSAEPGDVLVEGDKIAAVGTVSARADREIDVAGAAVAPGFIDVHTHYDAQGFWDPFLSPSPLHGTTTVLGGNCGFTLAPLSGRPEDTNYLVRMLSRVEGMPLESLIEGVRPDWSSFGEYLDRLEGRLAVNAGFLVGHSALRVAIMGHERALTEEASEDEIRSMQALLGRSLAEGGLGLSTSLSAAHSDLEGRPVPSRKTSHAELIALCKTVGEHEGTWLEATQGLIEFGETDYQCLTDMALAAGRSLNWNIVFISSERPGGFASQLGVSDYARARGATVFGLVQAGPSTLRINFRTAQMIDNIREWHEVLALPHPEKLRALADPEVRRRLEACTATGAGSGFMFRDWGRITIAETFLPHNKRWEGQTVRALSQARDAAPLAALLDLAIEEDLKTSFSPPGAGADEAAWRMRAQALTDTERCMIGGSDAGAHLDMLDAFTLPTRLLGEDVRTRGLIKLEEAVRRITSEPAERFGLTGRGRLAPGMQADIVVFDPDTVGAGPVTTRFDLPKGGMRLYAEATGISTVMVNGVPIVENGGATGKRGGSILRSGRDTRTVN